jgi:hypothetical protein
MIMHGELPRTGLVALAMSFFIAASPHAAVTGGPGASPDAAPHPRRPVPEWLTRLAARAGGEVPRDAISGRIAIPGPVQPPLSGLRIEVVGIDGGPVRSTLDPASGAFRVELPPASGLSGRRVSLAFVSPSFYLELVPGMVVPAGCEVQLAGPVVLRPVRFAGDRGTARGGAGREAAPAGRSGSRV